MLKREAEDKKNDEIDKKAELETKRFNITHKDNTLMIRATIWAGIGGALLGAIATFLLGKLF